MPDDILRGQITDAVNGRKPMPTDEAEAYQAWLPGRPSYRAQLAKTGIKPDPHQPEFLADWDAFNRHNQDALAQLGREWAVPTIPSMLADQAVPAARERPLWKRENYDPDKWADSWGPSSYQVAPLLRRLTGHEGGRAFAYGDSAGLPTVGVGHNLAGSGLTPSLAQELGHRPTGRPGPRRSDGTEFRQPLSLERSLDLLKQDVRQAEASVTNALGKNWQEIPDGPEDARKRALVEMMFVLGPARFGKFTDFRTALDAGDYPKAADALLDSDWADSLSAGRDRVVGKDGKRFLTRTEELAYMIRHGADHPNINDQEAAKAQQEVSAKLREARRLRKANQTRPL